MSSVLQSNLHAVHAPYDWLMYPLQAPLTCHLNTCQREDELLGIRFALEKLLHILLLAVAIIFRGILVDLEPILSRNSLHLGLSIIWATHPSSNVAASNKTCVPTAPRSMLSRHRSPRSYLLIGLTIDIVFRGRLVDILDILALASYQGLSWQRC